jgi:glycosyltransferase involved in cell wall biosynthesis
MGSEAEGPLLSVIVPVRDGAGFLPQSLAALHASELPRARWELIVVDDASRDSSAEIATGYADMVVTVPDGPRGAAVARNLGAAAAKGPYLVFVDADVCVHPDVLLRFAQLFQREADVSAAFGAYDSEPPPGGLVSDYRNLLHHYIHSTEAGETVTFWTGCGAVRAEVFAQVGRFNERQSALEDVELGYRMSALGHRIVLRPEIQGTHLKRWTLGRMIVTDVRDRGIPWVRLLLRQDGVVRPASLNIRPAERVYTALTALAFVAVLAAVATGATWWWVLAAVCAAVPLAGNGPLVAWFARQRGWWFALRVLPLRMLYYLLNAVSIVLALATHRPAR